MKLENRVAAITGGTAGIGRAIAEAYLAEGAKVSVMARNRAKATRMIDEFGAGDNCVFVTGDATSQSDVEAFVDTSIETFGQLDILVNNAGGAGELKPVADLPDDAWDLVMKWNLYSTFWACRRAVKPMIERGWGRIINMSSIEGKVGKPVVTAYTTAKHAVNGFTKSMAKEVGAAGVTVNAICPGIVITDIIRENGPRTAETMGISFEELINLYTQESAIKRPITVEEVAAAAVLLASEAGAAITGTCLSIDGGTAPY